MRTHISKVVSLCFTSTMLVAGSVAAQQTNDCQTVDADGVFTFRLPAGFKPSEQGVESFMLGYQRGSARFISICGGSASNDYHNENISNLREEATTVDGRHATIRTFIYKWERSSEYI